MEPCQWQHHHNHHHHCPSDPCHYHYHYHQHHYDRPGDDGRGHHRPAPVDTNTKDGVLAETETPPTNAPPDTWPRVGVVWAVLILAVACFVALFLDFCRSLRPDRRLAKSKGSGDRDRCTTQRKALVTATQAEKDAKKSHRELHLLETTEAKAIRLRRAIADSKGDNRRI